MTLSFLSQLPTLWPPLTKRSNWYIAFMIAMDHCSNGDNGASDHWPNDVCILGEESRCQCIQSKQKPKECLRNRVCNSNKYEHSAMAVAGCAYKGEWCSFIRWLQEIGPLLYATSHLLPLLKSTSSFDVKVPRY